MSICANCASVVFGTTHVKGELRDAFGVWDILSRVAFLAHSRASRVVRPGSVGQGPVGRARFGKMREKPTLLSQNSRNVPKRRRTAPS